MYVYIKSCIVPINCFLELKVTICNSRINQGLSLAIDWTNVYLMFLVNKFMFPLAGFLFFPFLNLFFLRFLNLVKLNKVQSINNKACTVCCVLLVYLYIYAILCIFLLYYYWFYRLAVGVNKYCDPDHLLLRIVLFYPMA